MVLALVDTRKAFEGLASTYLPIAAAADFAAVVLVCLFSLVRFRARDDHDHRPASQRGAADRLLVSIGFPYAGQVWFFRVLAVVAPMAVFAFTLRLCRELASSQATPLREWEGAVVRRAGDGHYEELEVAAAEGHPERPPAHGPPERREW